MSINEAIAHAREVAKRNREQWKNCPAKRDTREHLTCEECAEEHEQLAKWLEELKMYKEVGTVEGYKNAIECYNEEYTRRKSNEQYNKAIDDFVKALCIEYAPVSDGMQKEYDNVCSRFEKIAEQLKAGGKNE